MGFRDLSVFTSPPTVLSYNHKPLSWLFTWIEGYEPRSWCICGRWLINWVISPAHITLFLKGDIIYTVLSYYDKLMLIDGNYLRLYNILWKHHSSWCLSYRCIITEPFPSYMCRLFPILFSYNNEVNTIRYTPFIIISPDFPSLEFYT